LGYGIEGQGVNLISGVAVGPALAMGRAYGYGGGSLYYLYAYIGDNVLQSRRRTALANSAELQAKCCSLQNLNVGTTADLHVTDCDLYALTAKTAKCDSIMGNYCEANPSDIKCACLKPVKNPGGMGRPECTDPTCVSTVAAYKSSDMRKDTCPSVCVQLVQIANSSDIGLNQAQLSQVCPGATLPSSGGSNPPPNTTNPGGSTPPSNTPGGIANQMVIVLAVAGVFVLAVAAVLLADDDEASSSK